jgi:hypothetical protein
MGQFDFLVYSALYYGAVALTLWAFVDALIRPAAGYVAAGKLTKPGWAAITGLSAAVVYWFTPMSFLGLPAVIAGVVYLVDVRPAVRGLRRGNTW